MALRVIAGTAGGRHLVAPSGSARPTTDRCKEALFSILGARVVDAVVLDLYTGSGALAIEALSRGAARVVLVDCDASAEVAVRANLHATGFDAQVARFQRSTVRSFLAVQAPEAPFGLVFLDPPYDSPAADVADVLTGLADGELLASDATVVVERPRRGETVRLPAGWGTERERVYGDTLLMVAHAG
jgi:16S rRNA (guanine966-N2)-methyltransferase